MKRLILLSFLLILFNACVKEQGCTDPLAINYNSEAEEDNGSCIAILNGCTDVTAFNYNLSANINDGSCVYGSVSSIVNYTTSDGLLDNFVECIAVDINDDIWFGTSVGAQMFNGTDWTTYTTTNGLVDDNVKTIATTNNGGIWIGTDFGASHFDGVNWINYDNTNGLASNQVKSIDEDENGGIWIGTDQGVSYFAGSLWTSYSSDLHWSGVCATAFDSNGDKWFASPLGGITHFDDNTFTSYNESSGLLSQYVTDIIIDSEDNKWVGTSSGMSVLNSLNLSFADYTRMYLLPPPDTLNPVVNIESDSWGRIWASIYVGYLAQGGVAYWNGDIWQDLDMSDGLVGPNIKELAVDSYNNIWIATSTGVSYVVVE